MRFLVLPILFLFYFVTAFSAEGLNPNNDEEINSANQEQDDASLGGKIGGKVTVFGSYVRERPKAEERLPRAGIAGTFEFKYTEKFFGTTYGLTSEIELNSEDETNFVQLKEAGIIVEGENSGVRIFGIQKPVTTKMKVNSTTFAGSNEGLSGNWQNFIYFPETASTKYPFLTEPLLAIESALFSNPVLQNQKDEYIQPMAGLLESNIGISYISPRTKGIRFGISYFPENKTHFLINKKISGINETTVEDATGKKPYLEDILSIALNYYGEFSGLEVLFFSGFERATPVFFTNEDRRNLNTYSFGLNLSYLGFTIGGSLTNFNKSLVDRSILNMPKSYGYDYGIGYSIERYNLNASYFKSKFMSNRFSSFTLSFETKATKSLATYVQLATYRIKIEDELKNKGLIVVLGLNYIIN